MGTADEVRGVLPTNRIARHRTLLFACALTAFVTVVSGVFIARRSAGTVTAGSALHTPVTAPAAARLPEATTTRRPDPGSTATATTTTLRAAPKVRLIAPTLVTASGTEPSPSSSPPTEPTATTLTPTTILAPAVTATLPPPPPPFGASVLQWEAPASIEITAESTAVLNVRAHNPMGRAVSLAHPLGCTPRLDHREVCADIVQMIAAGAFASARYTIDAHGFAPGNYTLHIEGVLTVPVTVSPQTPA